MLQINISDANTLTFNKHVTHNQQNTIHMCEHQIQIKQTANIYTHVETSKQLKT